MQELHREANTLGLEVGRCRAVAGVARDEGADRADARTGTEPRIASRSRTRSPTAQDMDDDGTKRRGGAHPTKAPPASGCLFVLAAPSGGGKTSLVAALLEREPGIRLSVSYTTRRRARRERRRPLSLHRRAALSRRSRPTASFSSTPTSTATGMRRRPRGSRAEVARGHDVLLEIDWQGAQQVRRLIPEAVHIFILPPSLAPAARTPRKARPGHAGGHPAPARGRARRDAPLRRLRLCYYESGLCTSRRRSVRDRPRRPPDRPAADGAPCAPPAAAARTLNRTDPEDCLWPASRSTTALKRFPTASS